MSNIKQNIAGSLALLGYSEEWLEWGLLSEATLQEQVDSYFSDLNPPREHFRCSAFRRILSERSAITEREIEQYLALARIDDSQVMAQAMRLELLLWPRLTPEQFDRLTDHPDFAAPMFQKRALRRRLMTALTTEVTVSATTFANCLASQDATVQRTLVSRHELTSEQLQTLVEQGATQAIRNMARDRKGI